MKGLVRTLLLTLAAAASSARPAIAAAAGRRRPPPPPPAAALARADAAPPPRGDIQDFVPTEQVKRGRRGRLPDRHLRRAHAQAPRRTTSSTRWRRWCSRS